MSKYLWIKEYCLTKPEAKLESMFNFSVDVFKVNKKWFVAVHTDKTGQPIISVKCDPYLAQELRIEHQGKIVAGYHFNKSHWNSIYLESDLAEELIKKQIDMSYDLVVKKLLKTSKIGSKI